MSSFYEIYTLHLKWIVIKCYVVLTMVEVA